MTEIDSLCRYRDRIRSIPRLEEAEERRLAREYRAGSARAFDRLISANLQLVVKVAWHHLDSEMPVWDLIQTGNMGLVQLARHYDPAGEYSFNNCACRYIYYYLFNRIGSEYTIRIPQYRYAFVRYVNDMRTAYNDRIGKYARGYSRESRFRPSAEDVIDALHCPFVKLSIDDLDLALEFADGLYDRNFVQRDSRRGLFRRLQRLPWRTKLVVLVSFGIVTGVPVTLETIGRFLNVTRERVRQIKDQGIRTLRSSRYSGLAELLERDEGELREPVAQHCAPEYEPYLDARERNIAEKMNMYGIVFREFLRTKERRYYNHVVEDLISV